ncbi:MAG: Gfo/Idh/MocA family oxidoreductase [Acholeplasmataceae bacterium]
MIRAIMLGAGNRGLGTYGAYALRHPEDIKFIAIAEPDQTRREYFATQHQIDSNNQFTDALDVFKVAKFADAIFICTQDRQHKEQVLKALRMGYHVFLEKPMAVKAKDVLQIERHQKLYQRKVVVAHVLRYSPFFIKIKQILSEKMLGEIMSIDHIENVGIIHHSHSYVRGNWRNSQTSSPMIVAKSCHDMDIITFLLDQKPVSIASFGELSYFKHETMKNVPNHCMDGCPYEHDCPFFAPKVYLNAPDWMKFPVSNDLSEEALLKALKKGPYGRCVFRSNNDVVDHQTVQILYDKGTIVNFMMTAFTHEITRTIRIMGTKGELVANMNDPYIKVIPFGKDEVIIDVEPQESGHGGGDTGVMKRFINALKYDWDTQDDLRIAVMGHMIAFAAEESRQNNKIIDYPTFIEDVLYGTKAG